MLMPQRLCAVTAVASLAVFVLSTQAESIKPNYHLGAKPGIMIWGYFSAETPPVLKIKSGEIVEADTTDLSGIPQENPEQFFIDHKLSLDLPGVQDLIAIKKEV